MIIRYLKDSFTELNNVTWPTRKRGIKITIIVLIFMAVSAAVLGVVDYLFSLGLESILNADQNNIPQVETPVDTSGAEESSSVNPSTEAPETDSTSVDTTVVEEPTPENGETTPSETNLPQ